jgi:hypothetical protein
MMGIGCFRALSVKIPEFVLTREFQTLLNCRSPGWQNDQVLRSNLVSPGLELITRRSLGAKHYFILQALLLKMYLIFQTSSPILYPTFLA